MTINMKVFKGDHILIRSLFLVDRKNMTCVGEIQFSFHWRVNYKPFWQCVHIYNKQGSDFSFTLFDFAYKFASLVWRRNFSCDFVSSFPVILLLLSCSYCLWYWTFILPSFHYNFFQSTLCLWLLIEKLHTKIQNSKNLTFSSLFFFSRFDLFSLSDV